VSWFEWLVVVGFALAGLGLFSIAAAIRNLTRVSVEVAGGYIANLRTKPLALDVRLIDEHQPADVGAICEGLRRVKGAAETSA